jgi:hypothetical protein
MTVVRPAPCAALALAAACKRTGQLQTRGREGSCSDASQLRFLDEFAPTGAAASGKPPLPCTQASNHLRDDTQSQKVGAKTSSCQRNPGHARAHKHPTISEMTHKARKWGPRRAAAKETQGMHGNPFMSTPLHRPQSAAVGMLRTTNGGRSQAPRQIPHTATPLSTGPCSTPAQTGHEVLGLCQMPIEG